VVLAHGTCGDREQATGKPPPAPGVRGPSSGAGAVRRRPATAMGPGASDARSRAALATEPEGGRGHSRNVCHCNDQLVTNQPIREEEENLALHS